MSQREMNRKEVSSWDEAFRGLAPAIRQQSVRVAAYTQELFLQACAASFGRETPQGAERMKEKYADLAYKCGLYHQLGKTLVPQEYQIWNPSFSEEEKALYRKYTSQGRLLVAALQEKGSRLLRKKQSLEEEIPTKNISWLMMREACQQHMERYDGLGWPEGRVKDEISVIAQIVGLAKELDRLASQTRSETPFEEAYDRLLEQSGSAFHPELIEILKTARGRCRAVYKKYIHYTKTLPKTIPLVDKRRDRPMGLVYRPMVSGSLDNLVAYEAVPWFGAVLDQPEATESLEQLAPMLERTELMNDMTFYLMYEATDALYRMQNCRIHTEGILLPVKGSFFKGNSQWEALEQLFLDQPIEMGKLMLAVPESDLVEGNPQVKANLTEYIEHGGCVVLDDVQPGRLLMEEIREIGITHLRLDPQLYGRQETANQITVLHRQGYKILGGGVESYEIMKWLDALGVACESGPITGASVTEEELIRDCLNRERED